ncbi:MAG TPA: hypothetical protein ENN34_09245 [Deltaproteobacteria bacterium]|nr:YIP1 family protein [Desulfomonilia bacterium]HDP25616.1 hypothetical protein [Deltaproteobacteria bacterium]
MSSFTERVIRAIKLDPAVYEEVEADRSSMNQAVLVVILSSLAAGIGGMQTGGLGFIVAGTISALIGWFIWAFLTYIIGTKLLPEPQTRADYGELLRTIGFSSAPGMLRILGVIPFITGIVFLVSFVWMLVAMVIAVRQALDYTSTMRAVGVCIIGWIIQILLIAPILYLMGVRAGM